MISYYTKGSLTEIANFLVRAQLLFFSQLLENAIKVYGLPLFAILYGGVYILYRLTANRAYQVELRPLRFTTPISPSAAPSFACTLILAFLLFFQGYSPFK